MPEPPRARSAPSLHPPTGYLKLTLPPPKWPLLLRPERTFPFPPRPHNLIAATADVAVYRSLLREGPPAAGSRSGGVGTRLPTRSLPRLLRMRTRTPRVSALQSSCMRKRIIMLAKVKIQFTKDTFKLAHEAAWRPWVLLSLRNHIRARTRLGRIRPPTPLVRCPSCPVSQLTHVK